MKPWWYLSLPLLSCAGNAQANPVYLSPTHCVTTQLTCELPISLTWKFEHPTSFCLIKESDSSNLYCHNGATSGQVTIQLQYNKSEQLMVVDSKTGLQIQQFTLKVMVPNNALRKRKRHAWSIL
ncbi:DUF3019 domain-containing protein [Thalassotalea sp. PS06]|uniref:DUF3019 domain-containing protein n=1 Tax=Thalassotalea sp. PS06 TaxID=2594005 RepID=UPI0011655F5C|nr:DUF3019 domain-containing protein [Thalassotalea sp. PS06]QDP01685.1 DUF3019 domain-containing protein [Thalassotalea sp. PS06]